MKRTILIGVLAGVAVLGLLAADASAMYHPGVGRFMQRDPIGYADGMSLYEYARGSAVRYVDPSGELIVYAEGAVHKPFAFGLKEKSDAAGGRLRRLAEAWNQTGEQFYHSTFESPDYRDPHLTEQRAQELFERMRDTKQDEPVIIIAHSSGAAVVVRALELLTIHNIGAEDCKDKRRVDALVIYAGTVSRDHVNLDQTLTRYVDRTTVIRGERDAVIGLSGPLGDAFGGHGGMLGQSPRQGATLSTEYGEVTEIERRGSGHTGLFEENWTRAIDANGKEDPRFRSDQNIDHWTISALTASKRARQWYESHK